MGFVILLKGIALGFAVSAPIGPIGVLCINRTMNKKFISGFVSGMGAATADFFYVLIVAFGLTFISDFIVEQKFWFHIAGIILVVFVGIRSIFFPRNIKELDASRNNGLLNDYLSTFILTITNPGALLLFLAVFAGLGISDTVSNYYTSSILVIGVVTGSMIWWAFLSGLTNKLRKRLNKKYLRKIDKISGIIILLIGLVLLVDLIVKLS